MVVPIVTLIFGFVIGYLGQRARLCYIAGYRDFFLVRDTYVLKGMIGTAVGAGGGCALCHLLGANAPGFPMLLDTPGMNLKSAWLFAIAGGLILLALSINYMITGRMVEVVKEEMVAVVPIGTPLTVGPATITTLLLLATQYPIYMVLLSFALNMLIVWISFLTSEQIVHALGEGGIKAVSRVSALLLAAIGVNMIIRGLVLVNVLKAVP